MHMLQLGWQSMDIEIRHNKDDPIPGASGSDECFAGELIVEQDEGNGLFYLFSKA
jgi:hypothetical protein